MLQEKNEKSSVLNYNQSFNTNHSEKRLYLQLREQKKGRACIYMVPFFMEVLNIKQSLISQQISQCIIDLDNLAIEVDTVIDSSKPSFTKSPSVEQFYNLEERITNCFNALAGQPDLDILIGDTFKCIKISFKYNTTDRHLIYNFDEDISNSGCTTYYLLPLINYLRSANNSSSDIKQLFILISNYIQLLDDFVDLFDDLNSNVSTPVTEKLMEINQDNSVIQQRIFQVLAISVKKRLKEYFSAIKREIFNISPNNCDNILEQISLFHEQLELIPEVEDANQLSMIEYLQKIAYLIPPIVCYD